MYTACSCAAKQKASFTGGNKRVLLAGIQYAGGHLRELQRAMKNPAGNLGVILGEGTKRAKKLVGLGGDSMTCVAANVHPDLAESAKLCTVVSCVFLLLEVNSWLIPRSSVFKKLSYCIATFLQQGVLSEKEKKESVDFDSISQPVQRTDFNETFAAYCCTQYL